MVSVDGGGRTVGLDALLGQLPANCPDGAALGGGATLIVQQQADAYRGMILGVNKLRFQQLNTETRGESLTIINFKNKIKKKI